MAHVPSYEAIFELGALAEGATVRLGVVRLSQRPAFCTGSGQRDVPVGSIVVSPQLSVERGDEAAFDRFPGMKKPSVKPFAWTRGSTSREMRSGPLTTRPAFGRLRSIQTRIKVASISATV